jgi:hypothetical protein
MLEISDYRHVEQGCGLDYCCNAFLVLQHFCELYVGISGGFLLPFLLLIYEELKGGKM